MNFYLIPSAEITLFLIYKLIVDYQTGWFLQPSTMEGAILASLVFLAGFFAYLGFGGDKKFPGHKGHPGDITGVGFNPFWHAIFYLVISILLVVLILPINKNEPFFVHLVLKNKDLIGLLLLLLVEGYLYFNIAKFRRMATILSVIWAFCYRNLLLVIFIILVTVKIILLVPITRGLLVLNDTYIYWSMAKQIFHGSLDVYGFHHYPPLYSAILSPIFLFGVRNSLQHITLLNCLISSSAIFPLYLLAKQFLDKKLSLIFVILCATFPFQIAYPAILFSESLYYPLFFWAIYFSISNPDNPRRLWLWDLLFAGTLAAMWLTRYMTLPLIPIFLLIWWTKPEQKDTRIQLRPSKGKLIRLLVISVIILAAFGLWLFAGINSGVGIRALLGLGSSGQGNPDRITAPRLLFWSGISLGYLCLILAPVLHIGLQKAMIWKQIHWDGLLVRWIGLVTALSGMLMVEVTRHAWQAAYNFPDPTKFVGRYIIYISALSWLTAFILLREKFEISRRKLIIGGLISAAVIFTTFVMFMNRDLVIYKTVVNFRFIDVFTISILQWVFPVLIAVMITGTSLLVYKGYQTAAAILLAGGILCINLLAWPSYVQKMIEYETPARHLDALFSYLTPVNGIGNTKPILFVPPGSNFYEEELEVRGLDPFGYRIKQMNNDPLEDYLCKTRLMIKYPDGQQVAVIDQSLNCMLPDDATQSIYKYNDQEYAVVKIPAD